MRASLFKKWLVGNGETKPYGSHHVIQKQLREKSRKSRPRPLTRTCGPTDAKGQNGEDAERNVEQHGCHSKHGDITERDHRLKWLLQNGGLSKLWSIFGVP